jgi:hypothetical protein
MCPIKKRNRLNRNIIMPVLGYWGDASKNYVVFVLKPPFTWAEFEQGTLESLTLLKQAAQPLPVVIDALDASSVSKIPPEPTVQNIRGI